MDYCADSTAASGGLVASPAGVGRVDLFVDDATGDKLRGRPPDRLPVESCFRGERRLGVRPLVTEHRVDEFRTRSRLGHTGSTLAGGGHLLGGEQFVEQCVDPVFDIVSDCSDRIKALSVGIVEIPITAFAVPGGWADALCRTAHRDDEIHLA